MTTMSLFSQITLSGVIPPLTISQNSASNYEVEASSENAKNSELIFFQSLCISSLVILSSGIQWSATLTSREIMPYLLVLLEHTGVGWRA